MRLPTAAALLSLLLAACATAVRLKPQDPIELNDLASDPGETTNVAAEHPQLVEHSAGLLESERTPSEHFPLITAER